MKKRNLFITTICLIILIPLVIISIITINDKIINLENTSSSAEKIYDNVDAKNPKIRTKSYKIPKINWIDLSGNNYKISQNSPVPNLWWKGKGNYIEGYYCVTMKSVIKRLRANGFDEKTYPHHFSEEGFEMLGSHILCISRCKEHHIGDLVNGKLGTYLVGEVVPPFSEFPNLKIVEISTDWKNC